MDVSLTDEALGLLKLLEKGAKQGAALEQLRQHTFDMGPPLNSHLTQQGVRYLDRVK